MTEVEALHWIAELFEEPAPTVTLGTPRTAIPAWDSLGVLTLIAALDEQFSVPVSDDEIQTMATVGDVIAVLRKQGKVT